MHLARTSLFSLALLSAACGGEGKRRGECRFVHPDQVIVVTSRLVEVPWFARRISDPNALYLITNAPLSPNASEVPALRVDLATGAQRDDSVPYGIAGKTAYVPPGHVYFVTGPPVSPAAPALIRSGELHVVFDGSHSVTPAIGHWFGDRRLHLFGRQHYSGTRRVMLGKRTLLEQDLSNYDWVPGIDQSAAIEPDGDRVVCLCVDTATRIGIFHRNTLTEKK